MTEFDDREKAFEAKFAMDEQTKFRVEARACKLLGLWIAGQFGISGAAAETYAKEVVGSNLDEPGFGDVYKKVLADAQTKGANLTEQDLTQKMQGFMAEAYKQITAEAA
ncbi:MAG: DUF1476 family protein [Alphaproteobacteria bacterium]|nr:DUF1476 family protein [Alphaproteobacteria bacterium]